MDTDLAAAVVPYLSAVGAAYGGAVLERVSDSTVDAAADGTVGLGRRIIQAVLRRGRNDTLEATVQDVAENGDDEDAVAGLRRQLRRAFEADPELAAEVGGLLQAAGVTTVASGERSIAAHTIRGIAVTG